MGYPAKSYELFRRLGEIIEGDNKCPDNEVTRLLNKFRIQSFFVYDPVRDPAFSKVLEQDFLYFDRLTGNRMMFICLLQDFAGQKDARYRSFDFFNEDTWVGPKTASNVSDISLATQLLCSELWLDYEYAPYLVFTSDFRNNWVLVLDLTKDNVEQIMHSLAALATQITSGLSLEELTQSISRYAPDLREKIFVKKFRKSVAIKLKYFLSYADIDEQGGIADNNFSANISNWKKKRFDENKKATFQNLNLQAEQYSEEIIQIKTVQIALKIENKRVLEKRKRDQTTQYNFIHPMCASPSEEYYLTKNCIKLDDYWIPKRGLEQFSINLLKVCETLLSYGLPIDEMGDYRFFTINLGNFFENELNHSIGQLIRKEDGIEMPQYFHRLKPDNNNHPYFPDNLKLQHPRAIPLNKAKEGRYWEPPGMGESKLVWDSMQLKNPELIEFINKDEILDTLQESWKIIHRIRNKSSHPKPVTKADYRLMINAITLLCANKALEKMVNLKHNLLEIEEDNLSDKHELPF